MNKIDKNCLVVVLGMHRSGTSAITKSLELLGVGLGADLHPAGFDNPKGFWEDRDCLEINEELLKHLGSAYDRLDLAWDEIRSDSEISELRLKATQLIKRKLTENNGKWGFKDPRTCRLLSFWNDVFSALECEVSFVIAVRNPASVVASLAARNGLQAEKAYYLWLQHVLPSLQLTKGARQVVVDFDNLLENPYQQVERISRTLGLPLPDRQSPLVANFERDFLDSGLRHGSFTVAELALDSRASPLVTATYNLLFDLANDQESLESLSVQSKLADLYDRLVATSPAFNYINKLEDDRMALWQAIAERDAQIASLCQLVTERDGQIASLRQLVTEHDGQISDLCQALTERDGQSANFNQAIAERDGQLTSLRQLVTEHDGQISSLCQALTERDGQIASLGRTLAERDGQIASLGQTIAERDGQIASLGRTIAERDGQIASLGRTIAERDGQIASLLVERNHVFDSTSWKITKPLRFIGRTGVKRPYRLVRKILSDSARDLWVKLPLSVADKLRIKNGLFNRFPILFRWSQAYRSWAALNASGVSPSGSITSQYPVRAAGYIANEYVPLRQTHVPKNIPVKLIAFYLPQFHPIPENNAWWGDGFTEWTNVKPAQPQFDGHYQPHVPGELGYYDLLDSSIQHRQIELAKLFGVGGFCFYTYWFAGKLLLEKPVENYLADSSLDLPFCLCWANENWSRRWDGLDSEILIAQKHTPEDDLAFIRHVSRYMKDGRYIRIDGKPLLLVYRPSLLPSAIATAKRWRDWCLENGIGEIYLAYTQSFDAVDPAKYGFDAAIEFPPNNSSPPNITDTVQPLTDHFGGTVYDWSVFVERSRNYQRPDYKLFRSVCPSWDNTARRKNKGTIFLNSTPQGYREWLSNAVAETCASVVNPDERLVFVNAWNEWAEGAHLEPDTRFGYAYLQATRSALTGEAYEFDRRLKIVLVAHDAYPHGAQLLALNLAKTLNQGLGLHVDLVCLGDGPLKTEYAKWATVHDLSGKEARGADATELAKRLYDSGSRVALVNTTVSGYFLETLAKQGFECVALIHELRGVLDQLALHGQAASIATYAKKIVFPAIEVAASFDGVAKIEPDKLVIRPQGLYKRRERSANRIEDQIRLRQILGLPPDSQIILGVGYADHRKGIDLFVEAGLKLAERIPLARWVWIGHWEQHMQRLVDKRLAEFPALKDRFVFPGLQTDTDIFYGGADLFALTSREDPFPSVVLEALEAGIPVVGFEGAGGFIDLLNEGCGSLVAKEDAEAYAQAVGNMLEAPHERELMGLRGMELINERFSFRHYIFDLLDLLEMKIDRVSVIVPNYNYAQYLPERLASIIGQDYPIFEIVFLDDCSTDESVSIAREILDAAGIDYKIVINGENSGSVFRQWKKGVEIASGTHIWIAEADDSCSAGFLTEVTGGFRIPGTVLSYCESQQMDKNGKIVSQNYWEYVADVDRNQWQRPYIKDGFEEIKRSFSVKNTIPNVSAVLFEREIIKSVLDKNIDLISCYRIAGDWLVYTLALENGKIAFSPAPLNKHRRHNLGLTIGNLNKSQLEEICRMQEFIAKRHVVPEEKEEAAKAYIKTLSKQFGLALG